LLTGHDPVALRLQRLDLQTQTLVLAALAADRAEDRVTSPAAVAQLFEDFALPAPGRLGNVFAALMRKGFLTPASGRGNYKITPIGRARVSEQMSGLDVVALIAEGAIDNAPLLGRTVTSLVPFTLAPPALVQPLRGFLADHPFETNVFGMTRLPDTRAGSHDPVGRALAVAREVCENFGLEFHLASDRAITDDVWSNVMAHMWGSRYGVGFFEDRVDRGLNYNLVTEVGAMIMTGRRVALLKDGSIEKMPTDFVGMIYKSVDLEDASTVRNRMKDWLVEDLRIGKP
jgi:hypothetical protein